MAAELPTWRPRWRKQTLNSDLGRVWSLAPIGLKGPICSWVCLLTLGLSTAGGIILIESSSGQTHPEDIWILFALLDQFSLLVFVFHPLLFVWPLPSCESGHHTPSPPTTTAFNYLTKFSFWPSSLFNVSSSMLIQYMEGRSIYVYFFPS